MHIKCPACIAEFLVKPEQIRSEGRRVRCSVCGHVWHQKLEQVSSADMRIDSSVLNEQHDQPSSSQALSYQSKNLPMILPTPEGKAKNNYFNQLFLLFTIVFLLVLLVPKQLGVENLLNNQSFILQAANIRQKVETGKNIISYKIINKSAKSQKIPLVRIKFFDKNKYLLKSVIDRPKQKFLRAGAAIMIEKELNFPKDHIDYVELTIGNWLDFFLN